LIVVLNLMIGLLHPPMGMVLYVLARGQDVARANDHGDPAPHPLLVA
jgi:TRAP-type C4-dicarboxylate transport system permease large subunit